MKLYLVLSVWIDTRNLLANTKYHRLTSACFVYVVEGKENGSSDGSSSAAIKSDGGVENKRLGLEMAFGLVLFVFLLISPLSV